jgi:hypothetical protein
MRKLHSDDLRESGWRARSGPRRYMSTFLLISDLEPSLSTRHRRDRYRGDDRDRSHACVLPPRRLRQLSALNCLISAQLFALCCPQSNVIAAREGKLDGL